MERATSRAAITTQIRALNGRALRAAPEGKPARMESASNDDFRV